MLTYKARSPLAVPQSKSETAGERCSERATRARQTAIKRPWHGRCGAGGSSRFGVAVVQIKSLNESDSEYLSGENGQAEPDRVILPSAESRQKARA